MSRCPVCQHTEKKNLGEKNGFRVFTCKNCRSLYTENIDRSVATENYDDYYHEGNLSAPEFIRKILGKVISDFGPYRQSGRFLDVGCGAGTILEEAKAQGWQAEGLEVSAPAVETLRSRGFKIFHGTLHEAAYPESYFDVVTASEVIEHVDDPAEVLREMARILRPQGLLWMTTPHANGISSRMMGTGWSVISPPEHQHLFSIRGMRELLAKAGFTDCRFAVSGFNPFELVQFYRGRSPGDDKSGESVGEKDSTEPAGPAFDRV